MSAHSTLDPESFQRILGSASAVQECLVDTQSLSVIVEVRRLMARGELDVNGAMQVIADRARDVADATGVAIAVLKRDQLVYQAGSGSATAYKGRHVTATLSVSAKARREILRVENAETDKRIGAAICRQRGAKSLLILPIYRGREMAGVLEVLFGEAHAFQESEVLTYQLMVQVVEDAMPHDAQLEMKKTMAVEVSIPPLRIERNLTQIQKSLNGHRSRPNQHEICPTCGTALAPPEKLQPIPAKLTTIVTHRAARFPMYWRLRKVADLAAVVTVSVMASWIAYSYRHPLTHSALPKSNGIEQPLPSVPTTPVPTNTSWPQTAHPLEQARKAARRMPRRVRFGDNEVDYVTQSVTIRYFAPRFSPQPVKLGDSQVEYISDDVTVRHFTPKPALVAK